MENNYRKEYLSMLKWNRIDYVVVPAWIFIIMIILYSGDIGWWKLLILPMIVITIVLIKKIIGNEKEISNLK